MTENNDIDTKLKAVTMAYYTRLPGRYDELLNAWEKVQSQPDADLILELSGQFHKLAGSAGMYNAANISTVARELENNLKSFANNQSVHITESINADFLLLKQLISRLSA